jgi:hypothetical protein
MAYQKRTTVAKAAAPASIIILGSNALQYVSGLLGGQISDEASYEIVTGLYAGFTGLFNWLKNRRK